MISTFVYHKNDFLPFAIVDYIVMIALCFFVLPFTYFYAEEALDSEDELQLNYGSGDEEDYDVSTAYSPKHKDQSGSYKQSFLGKFWDISYIALR